MSEKKFDSKELMTKINSKLTKILNKIKSFGKKSLKFIGTVGAFLLAVVLVCWDKIKLLYSKLPEKFKVLSKIITKEPKPDENSTYKRKKSIFAGLSEKDYAKIWAICAVVCFLIFAVVIIVLSLNKPKAPPAVRIESETSSSTSKTVTISFGGSVIMNDTLLNSCKSKIGDYEIYDSLKYLNKCFTSDLNIVSVIGAVNESSKPVTGFPKTNYPVNLIHALKSVHINGIALASDHSFDAGIDGVDSTIAACEEQSITAFGLYKGGDDYNEPQIKEVNGIKIGFVNASGFTDDDYYTLTEDQKLNRIKHFNSTSAPNAVKTIMSDVDALKKADVDFIVALLRWGNAETTYPAEYTREIADTLVKNGVDIILGYGSNYLQKITYKEFEQTDGTKKNCLIMYDLGNIYSDNSSASETYAIPQDNMLVTVELSLSQNGTATISKAGYTPLYVSRRRNNDISNRAEFITIPSSTYASADERPEIFSTDEQWTWCKNSFERSQSRMIEWVEQKMTLISIQEDSDTLSSHEQKEV